MAHRNTHWTWSPRCPGQFLPEKVKKIISQWRVHSSFFYSLWPPQWPHFEPLYIEHISSSSNTIGLNLLSFSLKVTLCRSVAVLSIKTFRVLRVIFECSPERNRSLCIHKYIYIRYGLLSEYFLSSTMQDEQNNITCLLPNMAEWLLYVLVLLCLCCACLTSP